MESFPEMFKTRFKRSSWR